MFGVTQFFTAIYFLIILGICGFILLMLFRFVKAFEKIADTYSRNDR